MIVRIRTNPALGIKFDTVTEALLTYLYNLGNLAITSYSYWGSMPYQDR